LRNHPHYPWNDSPLEGDRGIASKESMRGGGRPVMTFLFDKKMGGRKIGKGFATGFSSPRILLMIG
jgi:hypothetical protein